MIKIRANIERKKNEAYKMVRIPNLRDMMPNLVSIGRELFNRKEMVGYTDDIHALFSKSEDGSLEFAGFAGDSLNGTGMDIGDSILIVTENSNYKAFLNPIEYSRLDLENCDTALLEDWHENVEYGKNSYYDTAVFVSCLWIYKTILKKMDVMNETERAIIDMGRN